MSETWDTTHISRLRPSGELERELLRRAQDDDHISVAAPSIMEVIRGLDSGARRDPKMAAALGWFVRLAGSGLFETLPLDRAAAILAGRLRALHPLPPTSARRRDGTKPDQRTGWVLDIQIAACAWINGRTIVTENTRDFEVLRDTIAELYPVYSPLVVRAG